MCNFFAKNLKKEVYKMDFLEMIIKLKLIYYNKILLISNGSFYIAVAEDAVILNKEIGLKVNCMVRKICKIGVPKKSIEKYKEKLNKLDYGYVILDFNKEKKKIIKIYEKEGTRRIEEAMNLECRNCNKNKYTRKMYIYFFCIK